MSNTSPVRIELTEEQRRVVRDATGRDASAIEFTVADLEERLSHSLQVEQLEDRIAPAAVAPDEFEGVI